MAAVNKVILVGNLGRDPELRYAPDGSLMVANVSVATTYGWKDRVTGERHEDTEWHRVVFYGRQADIVAKYLKKGNPIYVEGRLKTRKWADKEGVERYTTEVISDHMQMLGSKEGSSGQETPATVNGSAPVPAPSDTTVADLDDDIPF